MGSRVALIYASLLIACTDTTLPQGPSDAGIIAHAVVCMTDGGMTPDGGDGGPVPDCQGIDIAEVTIPILSPGMANATVQALPGVTDHLIGAIILDDPMGVFTFTDGVHCTASSCTFPMQALPHSLEISCSMPVAYTARLEVRGTQGPSDFDRADLTCTDNTGSPTITVTPMSIGQLNVPVGSTSATHTVTVTNNGTADLIYEVLSSDPAQWTVSGNGCLAMPPCVLAGGAAPHTFGVTFTPSMHHDVPQLATLTFDSNAGMPTVQLSGRGTGAAIDISPLDHDFLTQARNQLGTVPVTITNTGNAPLNVTVNAAMPSPLFGTQPAAPITFTNIMPNNSATFDATCRSASPTPRTSGSILVTSNAYNLPGGSATMTVHCEVVASDLQVTPSPINFMEVRKAAGQTETIAVSLDNLSATGAIVTKVELVNEPAALTLAGFSSGTIEQGSPETVEVILDKAADVDLAATRLEVTVDGALLQIPVLGKVVTAAARVAPKTLDLGTVCVGSPVAGMISMINDGTATLRVQAPTMDQGFAASSMSNFPLELVPSDSIAVEVNPVAMTPGRITGTMTWDVDAPNAPFTIPVNLELIASGTAISPGSLDFGPIDVDLTSNRSTITLQNCGVDPITITVDGLVASMGKLDGWDIQPRFDQRPLAPRGTMSITAAFAPKRGGRHVARIKLLVGDEQRFIELAGDGISLAVDRTSFYACSTTSTPARGWPIGLAIVLILRRRRRPAGPVSG